MASITHKRRLDDRNHIEVRHSPFKEGEQIHVRVETVYTDAYNLTRSLGQHLSLTVNRDWKESICKGSMQFPEDCVFEFNGSPQQLIELVKVNTNTLFHDNRFSMFAAEQ